MYILFFFFFNDTATTEIYTLSLHDALPIWASRAARTISCSGASWPSAMFSRTDVAKRKLSWKTMEAACWSGSAGSRRRDRESTRLDSSHSQNSYAVLCLEKKKHTLL